MSDPARGYGGVRLPLLLLLAFLTVVAGVVVWLSVTGPEIPAAPASSGPGSVGEPLPRRAAPSRAPSATHETRSPQQTPSQPAAPSPGKAVSPPAPAPAGTRPERSAPPPAAPAPPAPPPAPSGPDNGGVKSGPQNGAKSGPQGRTGTPPENGQAETRSKVRQSTATAIPPPSPSDNVEIAKLPAINSDKPLKPAPDPDLIQKTSIGPLPRRAGDGRAPWRVYARPFNLADKRPRVALVVTGLGMSEAATESAIQGLPGAVTLAFSPYAPNLENWIRLTRAAGHEVLMDVPMEPINYPAYDPGPQTLLTSLDARDNLDRLRWVLSRGTGYVGVVDFTGSRFTASANSLRPILAALKKRGLMYLDSGSSAGSVAEVIAQSLALPEAVATLTLDDQASRVEIDRKFAKLEATARHDKQAIGIGSPYPVTLERMASWTRQLVARGIALAPVSAMVQNTTVQTGTRR